MFNMQACILDFPFFIYIYTLTHTRTHTHSTFEQQELILQPFHFISSRPVHWCCPWTLNVPCCAVVSLSSTCWCGVPGTSYWDSNGDTFLFLLLHWPSWDPTDLPASLEEHLSTPLHSSDAVKAGKAIAALFFSLRSIQFLFPRSCRLRLSVRFWPHLFLTI